MVMPKRPQRHPDGNTPSKHLAAPKFPLCVSFLECLPPEALARTPILAIPQHKTPMFLRPPPKIHRVLLRPPMVHSRLRTDMLFQPDVSGQHPHMLCLSGGPWAPHSTPGAQPCAGTLCSTPAILCLGTLITPLPKHTCPPLGSRRPGREGPSLPLCPDLVTHCLLSLP